jgi:tRNA C32,U32 (ribose-2'-O)-methylase TrmJ
MPRVPPRHREDDEIRDAVVVDTHEVLRALAAVVAHVTLVAATSAAHKRAEATVSTRPVCLAHTLCPLHLQQSSGRGRTKGIMAVFGGEF